MASTTVTDQNPQAGDGRSAPSSTVEEPIQRRAPFGTSPTVGERGTDTQRRILEATMAVLAEVSYADLRVELIAAKAGCSRPAFYQYFSSKDDAFFALAARVGREMVGLAEQLGKVTPDAAGLAHLSEWIGAFMAMHESRAPVFAAYPAASHAHRERAGTSVDVNQRTGRALLKAFGKRENARTRPLITLLVAILIRSSFYAEQAPKGLDQQPLVDGLAKLFHRTLARPIDGVNLHHGRPLRSRIKVTAPSTLVDGRAHGPRGQRTRKLLLDAGASVLPARGYHDTRVDDIVEAAGVSHGTFYRYFDNVDGFFKALGAEAGTRMIELVDRLPLDAPPAELRAWLDAWFSAYAADGGVISTWQEMRVTPELATFSQEVGAAVFTRLERLLAKRDFGNPQIDASTFLALIERGPYNVLTLDFTGQEATIDAMVTVMRRGYLAIED